MGDGAVRGLLIGQKLFCLVEVLADGGVLLRVLVGLALRGLRALLDKVGLLEGRPGILMRVRTLVRRLLLSNKRVLRILANRAQLRLRLGQTPLIYSLAGLLQRHF